MPKLVQRLLIFFLGIPLVIACIIPQVLNHLPLHILILIFSFMASYELNNIISSKYQEPNKVLLIVLSISLPTVSYFCGLFKLDYSLIELTLVLDIFIIFTSEIFGKKDFDKSNEKIATGVFTVIYCGYFITFISRLTKFEHSSYIISLFLILVFISDSAAWLFGMLFGKNNRGVIPASPNKSVAGFIGAYLGSISIVLLIKLVLWKDILVNYNIWLLIGLAIIVTTAGIVGDLIESVFKRSSGCKDSGNVILGRGGALDSIDSILAAAPFYYFILNFILK